MIRRLSVGVALVVLIASCAQPGTDDASTSSNPSSPATTVSTIEDQSTVADDNISDDGDFIVITVNDFSFPLNVQVPADRGVQWVNESGADHNIRFDAAPIDLPDIDLGRTAVVGLTFPPGDYSYFCTIHPNMKGSFQAA